MVHSSQWVSRPGRCSSTDRAAYLRNVLSAYFALAIVAAVLAAQGILPRVELRRTVLLGEVGLDGRVRPVRGVLPATLAAARRRLHPGDRAVAAGR